MNLGRLLPFAAVGAAGIGIGMALGRMTGDGDHDLNDTRGADGSPIDTTKPIDASNARGATPAALADALVAAHGTPGRGLEVGATLVRSLPDGTRVHLDASLAMRSDIVNGNDDGHASAKELATTIAEITYTPWRLGGDAPIPASALRRGYSDGMWPTSEARNDYGVMIGFLELTGDE